MLCRLLTATVIAASCLALAYAAHADADAGFPDDVTFQGTIEPSSGTWFSSHGGTVLFTFTPDLSALLRVEIRGFVKGSDYYLSPFRATYDRAMVYSPPSPVVDGAFTALVPLNEVGMGSTSLSFAGTIDSDTNISGTAGLSCVIGKCTLAAPFSATGPIDTPPAAGDLVFKAHLANGKGTLLLALNEDENVTSFALLGVSFDDCQPGYQFNVRTFFDTPTALSGGSFGVRVAQQLGAFVRDAHLENGVLSGTLRLIYLGGCETLTQWTTAELATETPLVPPTPAATSAAPTLPPAGRGPEGSDTTAIVLLPALVASLMGAAAALVALGLAATRKSA